MKFGSLFSGIGGFDLGFERAGMDCAWQCEIDAAASSVLAQHWPGVKRYTDVRHIGSGNLEPVDLICGGFPCQDVSVAGKRAGLAGERSGLWFEFHRILSELAPEWVVIENVPGLLSSNGGADFAAILRGLVELGYGVAWRILDAQYFGVAQRRRRVFIVGHLGDGRAAEILFERESGSGDTAPSRQAGTRVAGTIGSSIARSSSPGGGGLRQDLDSMTYVASALSASHGGADDNDAQAHHLVAHTLRAEGHDASEDGTGRGVPIVFESRYARNGRGAPDTIVPPLKAQSGQSGKGDAAPIIAWDNGQGDPNADSDGTAFALNPQGNQGVAVTDRISHWVDEDDRVRAIQGDGHSSTAQEHVYFKPNAVVNSLEHARPPKLIDAGVRRLMPVECERLQGFPDHWTAGQSDSARYKQCGNTVEVDCAEWIARRIAAAQAQLVLPLFAAEAG